MIWHQKLLMLLGILLGSCQLNPNVDAMPVRGFSFVIPIYNEVGLEAALATLGPHLRADDRFMIVSGNTSGSFDTAWVNRAALVLSNTYPTLPIYTATSGLQNVERAATELSNLVDAVVYVYEPNFPNQPEFDWEFRATKTHFEQVSSLTRRWGFRTVGKPTGRPLLQSSLQTYAWDYAQLASTVDELFVQTQTYCKDSPGLFAEAVKTLFEQFRASRETTPWIPQVTIDPNAPNGTTVAQAQVCIREARKLGVPGTVLWWSPPFAERAAAFIASLNGEEGF